MTKTNRFTLIATFLLGVLLYTILRFAHDLNLAWDGSTLDLPPAITDTAESTQPRIVTTADLRTWLDAQIAEQAVDSTAALNTTATWRQARGFSNKNSLFGSPDAVPPTTDDEATLNAQSEAGNAAATQALAERVLFTDPFRAIELFHSAAEQGSTFALLRISSLLEALDSAGIGAEATDARHRERVTELTKQGAGNSLRLTALGYAVTALRDGGIPLIDYTLLAWLDQLQDEIPHDQLTTVCEWSENTLLNIAKARARHGKQPVTTNAPPVFLAIPELSNRLPCNRTAYPIENLLDLTHCTVTPVRNATDDPLDLYLCPTG